MKIAIAGYNGFIGKSFVEDHPGWEYIHLTRELLYGDPGELGSAIDGAGIVINLAGSPVNKRWTARNRRNICMSRFGVNKNLVSAINGLEKKPELFITASAIGIYGHEGVHDEKEYKPGKGFMTSVVQRWEEPVGSLDPAVKVAVLRIGLVLGNEGGSLVPLRKIMRFGIAPVMGSGKQIYSFIHIRDLTAAIGFILKRRLEGVFNLCAPNPVENSTFTKILARETGAPVQVRIPVGLLKIMMGKAHKLVSEGQHVIPARLLKEEFRFRYPDIETAIRNLLQER